MALREVFELTNDEYNRLIEFAEAYVDTPEGSDEETELGLALAAHWQAIAKAHGVSPEGIEQHNRSPRHFTGEVVPSSEGDN